MVQIRIASQAGFCMGVRRAVNLTLDESKKYKGRLQTLGALIHNPQIVDLLEKRGIRAIPSPDGVEKGKVIIRAHGVPPGIIKALRAKGVEILDATCPHVARIHRIIQKHSGQGDDIVIAGDQGHAEVTGLEGSANGKACVISSVAELDALPALRNPCLVAQTTQSVAQFKEIADRMRALYPNASVYDTICRATEDRQSEIIALAARSDLTLVVGGKSSANTQRLVEVARKAGSQAMSIEDESELPPDILKGKKTVLVAAGASTPTWMIRRVAVHLKKMDYENRSRILRWIVRGTELLSSAYLGLGFTAAVLALAVWSAAGVPLLRPAHLWIVFSYILAMHALNHLTNIEANQLQEIFKREPINRFRRVYIAMAVGALLSAFLLAFRLNFSSILFVAFCEAAGIVYNLRIFPRRLARAIRRERIKDIPLSKDLGISLSIEPKEGTTKTEVAYTHRETGAYLNVFVEKSLIGKTVDIFNGDEFVLSAAVGKNCAVSVHKRSPVGKAVLQGIVTHRLRVLV